MSTKKLLKKTLMSFALGVSLPLFSGAQTFTPHDVGGPGSTSEPRWFTEANGKSYFGARTPNGDQELHVYDPATGQVTLIDVAPGSASSNPRELVEVGGNIFFQGTINFDTELQKYNTSTGVITTYDLNPTGSTMPTDIFAASNGMIYFRGRQSTPQGNDQELWEFNPNTGQAQVYEIFSGISQFGPPNSSYPDVQCEYQGKLYINAQGPVGKELYSFDMNTKQHTLVWDIAPGTSGSGNQESGSPKGMTVFNGKIYGSGYRPSESNEMIIYDPSTGDKEFRVIDGGQTIFQGSWTPAAGYPTELTELNGDLYFMAAHTTVGYELFKLDGQTDQISLAYDTWPGTYIFTQGALSMTQGNVGDPKHFVVRNGLLYYTADSPNRERELWAHDPATGQSTMVNNYWPGLSPLGIDNRGDLQWTTLLSNGDLIACGSTEGFEDEVVVVSWCPDPASIAAPASLAVYKYYLAQVVQWPAVNHPNLIGYNIYIDNGTSVSTHFVDASKTQWIPFTNNQPGTYTYEIRSLIEVYCEGSLQQFESATSATASITYNAIEPQCDLFGTYQIEFQNIGGVWYTNLYQWVGGAWQFWVSVPTTVEQLFWCSQYGGTPPTSIVTPTTIKAVSALENEGSEKNESQSLQEYLEELLCNENPDYCSESTIDLSGGVTSISEEATSQIGIDVFPNPARDVLNYTLALQNENVSYVNIVDALGREVYRNTENGIGQHQINLDSDLQNGIYFLQVVTDVNHRYTTKFSIAK